MAACLLSKDLIPDAWSLTPVAKKRCPLCEADNLAAITAPDGREAAECPNCRYIERPCPACGAGDMVLLVEPPDDDAMKDYGLDLAMGDYVWRCGNEECGEVVRFSAEG